MARTEAELLFTGKDRTRAAFSSVNRSLRDTTAALTRVGAVVGTVFTGAFVAGVVRANTAIDDLGKSASKLGLTVEALQGLRIAAEEAGVSQTTLTTGVRTSQRAISESIRGLETYSVAFRQLNLNVAELSQLSPEQAFERIGGAIGGLENQFQRAAVAQQIFGRAGTDLLNVFNDISVLEDAARFVEEFGLGLSELEVDRVERANDAFARVGTVLNNIGNQISVRLAPFTQAFSDTLLQSLKNAGDLGNTLDGVFDRALPLIGGAANALKIFEGAWLSLRIVVTGFAVAVSTVFDVLADLGRGVGNTLINVISLPFRIGLDAVEAFLRSLSRIPGISGDFEEAANAAARFRDSLVNPLGTGDTFVDDFSRNAREQFQELEVLYNQIVSEPLPTDDVDSFFNRFKERLDEIRNDTTISEAVQGAFDFSNIDNAVGSGASDVADQRAQERAQQELQRLRDRFSLIQAENEGQLQLELERERQAFEERVSVLDELAALEIERRAEINQEKEELEAAHQQRIADIVRRDSDRVAREERRSQQQRTRDVGSFFNNLQGLSRAGGRTLFEVSKAASIAQGLLSLRESISSSYKVGARIGGPPLGAAFAAAAGAAQLANLAAIRSTSFDGGGGATGSGGGGVVSGNDGFIPQAGDFEANQAPTQVTIQLGDSQLISRDTLIEIHEQLNELAEDGIPYNIDFA